jgi:hypothetical protein
MSWSASVRALPTTVRAFRISPSHAPIFYSIIVCITSSAASGFGAPSRGGTGQHSDDSVHPSLGAGARIGCGPRALWRCCVVVSARIRSCAVIEFHGSRVVRRRWCSFWRDRTRTSHPLCRLIEMHPRMWLLLSDTPAEYTPEELAKHKTKATRIWVSYKVRSTSIFRCQLKVHRFQIREFLFVSSPLAGRCLRHYRFH